MAERAVRLPLWARVALPVAVLVVALVIGSGALDSSRQTTGQRAAAIEAGVRCPSCTDLSVAQSNATTAIAVRHQIESMVAAGRSNAAIDQALVSEYGQTILSGPARRGRRAAHLDHPDRPRCRRPGRGGRRLLAPEPRLRRAESGRGRAVTVDGSPTVEQQGRSPRDEQWYLTDERDFLQRSLADADREREAGDLSDEDHAVLVARDASRLAEVEDELAALDVAAPVTSDADAPPSKPSADPWRCGARSGSWRAACSSPPAA